MKIRFRILLVCCLSALLQSQGARPSQESCEACIRAHEEFLASDVLGGRGSGTRDELLAATYIASQLRQYGVEPAGASYIQHAVIEIKGTDPRSKRLRDQLGS